MDYLFGAQDKTHEGIFSATSKENWLCCLVECRRGEQKIAELWNSKRLIVGGEAPENDKAAGTAIVLSPGLVSKWRLRCHSCPRTSRPKQRRLY
jgi:hypothetical protein